MLRKIIEEIQEGKHDSAADDQFRQLNFMATELHHKIKKAKGAKKKELEGQLAAMMPMLQAMKKKTTKW